MRPIKHFLPLALLILSSCERFQTPPEQHQLLTLVDVSKTYIIPPNFNEKVLYEVKDKLALDQRGYTNRAVRLDIIIVGGPDIEQPNSIELPPAPEYLFNTNPDLRIEQIDRFLVEVDSVLQRIETDTSKAQHTYLHRAFQHAFELRDTAYNTNLLCFSDMINDCDQMDFEKLYRLSPNTLTEDSIRIFGEFRSFPGINGNGIDCEIISSTVDPNLSELNFYATQFFDYYLRRFGCTVQIRTSNSL